MQNKYYAGIGARKTPDHVRLLMTKIAYKLCNDLFILRSGGAGGADTAFFNGSPKVNEIFQAKDATPEAIEEASKHHPAWDKCTDFVRALHGRNAMIVLGKNLKTPVEFVLCWTPRAEGGVALD